MNLVFFDDQHITDLYPITLTRPASEIRIGILTIQQKWLYYFDHPSSHLTLNYLSSKFPPTSSSESTLYINGALCPTDELIDRIDELEDGQGLSQHNRLLAYQAPSSITREELLKLVGEEFQEEITILRYPWDIFRNNGSELELDFDRVTEDRTSAPISETNTIIGDRIFVEEGATVECSILNSDKGAIYVGAEAEIMENSVVRGPLAMLPHSVLKLSTKIYGATTLGPYCKVGGEVNNSVLIGYSNKGHDGFLGNSVISEWCNLGADTNNSNLKNNYGTVKAFNYTSNDYISTDLQFCGLIMGDHSKSGINTMFNTGTVVGVSANIYGGDFPPKYIPSFSWGGANGFVPFELPKAKEVAVRMMERRAVPFTQEDESLFEHLSEETDV
jgi:UDP-N-acetylglucosamine diphosphorylase/glucosamine-1-phosphate N-acetyltransferase